MAALRDAVVTDEGDGAGDEHDAERDADQRDGALPLRARRVLSGARAPPGRVPRCNGEQV